ncbi:UNVERIFIED_CONTAM: hypothetical protein Sradi_3271200 [Sesamum radiatum]|uniref:Uncharacterized protein n=1 Tax=Sesamum radiatum TaxID=300843 RepID=A0AAW2R0Q6_SESRA
MASSNESIRFMGENRPDEDPSEATSKRIGLQAASPSSGRMRSRRQAVAAFRCLLDEEDEVGVMRRRPFSLARERRWLRRKGWSHHFPW